MAYYSVKERKSENKFEIFLFVQLFLYFCPFAILCSLATDYVSKLDGIH